MNTVKIYKLLMTASAYSWVLALPPRSPVMVCSVRQQLSMTDVVGLPYLSFRQGLEDGTLYPPGMLVEAHMLQHHYAGQ